MATTPDGDGSTDPVAAARAGDPAAQAALIRRYYPMVHALCVRLLGDQDRALDIAQEAAVEAILGLDRLRHDDRFGAWMAGIGLNLCRRLLRDRDWAVFSLDALLRDVFYAQVILASGTVVDARPSDALNLAAVGDAPVYVAAGLLEHFAQADGGFPDPPPAR